MIMDLLEIKYRHVVLTLLFVFATAFAPFVGDDQRNYLVILVSFLAVPVVVHFSHRLRTEFVWVSFAMVFPLLVILINDTFSDLSTIGYTWMFSMAYLAIVGCLRSGYIDRTTVIKLLQWVVILYAFISILQMLTSLVGLPIPNLISSKGLWSYNSFAVEPSHAGRALVMTMLVYLILLRKGDRVEGLWDILRQRKRILIAFFVCIGLTGSALAALFAPLAIFLSLSKRWIFILTGILLLAWPMLYMVDLPVVQRGFHFINALPTMDIHSIAKADHSAAIRVMPFLIYLDKVVITEPSFWFGGGLGSISTYIQGELLGAGELVAAGFIPGYLISFGVLGTLLFLWVFVLRFLTLYTLPVVVIWLLLFTTSAWNTQLFWYGLMLLRVMYHFRYTQEKVIHQPSSQLDEGIQSRAGLWKSSA